MNKIAKEKLKSKILDFFKHHPNKNFKIQVLFKNFNVEKKNYPILKEIIESLVVEKQLTKVRKNTFHFHHHKDFDYKGMLSINKRGVGFVAVEGLKEDLVVRSQNLNGAFHQDEVVVDLVESRGRRQEAEVIQITRRNRTKFVGTLDLQNKFGFVIVDDPKVPQDFYIAKEYLSDAKNGDKVVVEIIEGNTKARRPEAKIIEVIGEAESSAIEIESIFRAHGIQEKFSDEVMNQANFLKLDIKNEVFYRLDLRDEIVFTIDPIDARDFDDAVSLAELANGNLSLGVHIADVSHFVQENTELDKEALSRGCSVYLVDRVIPMLPEKISNHLCSLVPNEDRLTYSILMEIDKNLDVVSYDIKKSLIHSKKRFTYEEAQDILEKKTESEFSEILLKMDELAKKLRKNRFENGSIDFQTPEVRFELDEKGKPTGIIRKKQLDSMKLIEEFMLLANVTSAKHIEKLFAKNSYEFPFIYRVHEKPSPQKLQFFQSFLSGVGYDIKFPHDISPKKFQELVGDLLSGENADIINDVAVRTMMKALYSTENIGHFGLGFSHYSHFTSPIRRYPDLMIHRILFEYEMGTSSKRRRYLKRNLPDVCRISSDREIIAERAERDSIKFKQVEFMQDHVGNEFIGKISGVTEFGIFVEIEEFLIEGLIRIENLTHDRFRFDNSKIQIFGENTGETFHLGKRIKIQVREVNKTLQQIDFDYVQ
jgi:ribonuclease R